MRQIENFRIVNENGIEIVYFKYKEVERKIGYLAEKLPEDKIEALKVLIGNRIGDYKDVHRMWQVSNRIAYKKTLVAKLEEIKRNKFSPLLYVEAIDAAFDGAIGSPIGIESTTASYIAEKINNIKISMEAINEDNEDVLYAQALMRIDDLIYLVMGL